MALAFGSFPFLYFSVYSFLLFFRGPMERKQDKAGDLYDIIVVI